MSAPTFDYGLSPSDCLEVASDREIEQCQEWMAREIGDAGEHVTRIVGHQGDARDRDVVWIEKYGFWWCYEDADTRHWNAFGIADSAAPLPERVSITCEINPPVESTNNQPAGRFLKDNKGGYYITHKGRFNSRSETIYLGDYTDYPKVKICNQGRSVFIVSRLDNGLIQNLFNFVKTIYKIKNGNIPTSAVGNRDLSAVPDYSYDSRAREIVNDGCFVEERELSRMFKTLERKKNLILQGPPGTGKTWLAKKLALVFVESKEDMKAIQFHPNLSYEDFVRGWRPQIEGDKATGTLTLEDGAFLKLIDAAKRKSERKFVMVIEEINRGNPANIFGEMLTLLEADKRKRNEALALSYPRDTTERIFIPDNLYIIGTMNVADRSIASMDLALRRRFGFFALHPVFGKPWQSWVHKEYGVDGRFLADIAERLNALNETISDNELLGPHFRIGHSYVIPHSKDEVADPMEWFSQIVEREIGPLLEEYWFADIQRARDEKEKLLTGIPTP